MDQTEIQTTSIECKVVSEFNIDLKARENLLILNMSKLLLFEVYKREGFTV